MVIDFFLLPSRLHTPFLNISSDSNNLLGA